MKQRLFYWLRAYLIAIDAAWFLRFRMIPYVFFDNGDPPSPYETISSFTGRMANLNVKWAVWLQPKIDKLFNLIDGQVNHCQWAIVRADWLKATLS